MSMPPLPPPGGPVEPSADQPSPPPAGPPAPAPGTWPQGYPTMPVPGYPIPYQLGRAPKRRPSAWWFLPGVIALVIAAGCTVVGGFAIAALMHTDGYVQPGRARTIVLQGAGAHMLFIDQGTAPTCTVTEGSGQLALSPVRITDTVDIDTGSWLPFASFTTAGTTIEVACGPTDRPVRVGAPAGGAQYVRIGFAFIAAIGLGLVGLVEAIVVLVLILSRPSRKVTG